jgi:hypothetical protein
VNIKKPWSLVQCTFSVSDNISKNKSFLVGFYQWKV